MTLPKTPPMDATAQTRPLTNEQLMRNKALRRFNWLYIYTPIIVVVVLTLGILALLTWQSLVPDSAEKMLFLSGLADLILIGWMCPMTLILSLGPISGIYFLYRRNQRGSYVREPLQRLVWRTDSLLDTSQDKIKQVQPRIAEPFITAHGWAAFVRNIGQQIVQLFNQLLRRSKS
jgi:hypothetical protein